MNRNGRTICAVQRCVFLQYVQYYKGPRGVAVKTVIHFPRFVNIRRHVSDQTTPRRLLMLYIEAVFIKKLCFCEPAG